MWLSEQLAHGAEKTDAEISTGKVTIAGEQAAVMLQGERRGLGTLSPAGIIWAPAAGDEVVVMQTEDGERFIMGTASGGQSVRPGEIILSCGENSITIGKTGIELRGSVRINGVTAALGTDAAG